jgi:hypothetical protein
MRQFVGSVWHAAISWWISGMGEESAEDHLV